MQSTVKTHQTEHFFVAEMGVGGFILTFNVKTSHLRDGASLSNLKNIWVRDTLACHGKLLNSEAVKAAARIAVESLRPLIEHYFDKESR